MPWAAELGRAVLEADRRLAQRALKLKEGRLEEQSDAEEDVGDGSSDDGAQWQRGQDFEAPKRESLAGHTTLPAAISSLPHYLFLHVWREFSFIQKTTMRPSQAAARRTVQKVTSCWTPAGHWR